MPPRTLHDEMAVVRVSDEARDLFRDFADQHGVSVSALLESFARRLPPPETKLWPRLRDAVEEARAIDVERRRRG